MATNIKAIWGWIKLLGVGGLLISINIWTWYDPDVTVELDYEYEVALNRWRANLGVPPLEESMAIDDLKDKAFYFRSPKSEWKGQLIHTRKAMIFEDDGTRRSEEDSYFFIDAPGDTSYLNVVFLFNRMVKGQNPYYADFRPSDISEISFRWKELRRPELLKVSREWGLENLEQGLEQFPQPIVLSGLYSYWFKMDIRNFIDSIPIDSISLDSAAQ